jgi:hypothetical protein
LYAVQPHSGDKLLPSSLGTSINEEQTNYTFDKSLMASRWATTTTFYPPKSESIEKRTTEWLRNEERQEEEGAIGKLMAKMLSFCHVLQPLTPSKI